MLAAGVGEVSRGIVVVQLDVGDQPGARVHSLDQVVGKQRVFGEAPPRRALEGVDVVDPLAGVAPLRVQVLVHVGHGHRVRVHPRVAGVDGRETRTIRARQRDPDARLQDPVSLHDPAESWIVDGAVQRVGHRPHQEVRRVAGEDGVGVQGDHVARLAQQLHVSHHRHEGVGGAAAQKAVELRELAALALPPHPDPLPGVPEARPVKQVEDLVRAAREAPVQIVDPLPGRLGDGLVLRRRFGGRVDQVAEQSELQVTVPVREKLDFQVLERLADGGHTRQQRRHHHHGAQVRGDPAFAQVELGEDAGREKPGEELLDDTDRDVVGRDQRDQQRGEQAGRRSG